MTPWRRLEWVGVSLSLFLYTGAFVPLLMLAPDGMLDPGELSKLRLMLLPMYLVTLAVLSRHPSQVALVGLRNLPMLALVLLPFVTVFWSVSGSVTIRREIAFLLSTLFAVLLTIRFTPRQKMLLFGGVFGLCSLLSVLLGFAMPGLSHAPGEGALRGIFVHKNVMGWIACLTVVFGMAMLRDQLRGVRRLGRALLVFGLAGTLLSQSATSLLAAILAITASLVLPVVARQRGMARLVFELILVQLVVLALLFLIVYLPSLLEALGKDATLTGRVPLWAEVDHAIAARPLLGYGYGAFWDESNPIAWQIWSTIGWQAPHAHNGYRDLLLNGGVIGLLLFVLVIVRAMKQGIDLLTSQPDEGYLWCTVAIIVCLFLNLSESSFLDQNDATWLVVSTAILSLSFGHAAVATAVPRHQRVALTAS